MPLGVLRRLRSRNIVTRKVSFFRILLSLSTSLVIYVFNIFETLSPRRNVLYVIPSMFWNLWGFFYLFCFGFFFLPFSYFVSQCNCFLMEPRRLVSLRNILFACNLNIFVSCYFWERAINVKTEDKICPVIICGMNSLSERFVWAEEKWLFSRQSFVRDYVCTQWRKFIFWKSYNLNKE